MSSDALPRGHTRWASALSALLALASAAALLSATRWGIGVSHDSYVYIAAAQSLLDGQGYTIPIGAARWQITHFPPFFPALLALTGTLGVDPLGAARWLNVGLFAATLLLVSALIYRSTRGSIARSIWGALIVATSTTTLGIHAFAWTEPTSIFLGLAGFSLLALHLDRPRRSLLFTSAALLGLAFLTRYAGATFVVTGLIAILLLSRTSLSARALDAAMFAIVSCGPMALWLARNRLVAGNTVGREISFHPLSGEHVAQGVSTVVQWVYAPGIPLSRPVSFLVAAAGLSWLLVLVLRQIRPVAGGDSLRKLLLIFVLVYALFLVFSISFIDAYTPLDYRILSIVLVAGTILIFSSMRAPSADRAEGRDGRSSHLARRGIIVAGLGVSALVVKEGVGWIVETHDAGVGFTSRAWRTSESIERVKRLTPGVLIFTNEPAPVYVLTGRAAGHLPRKVNAMQRRKRERYPEEMAALRDKLRRTNGVVVYFKLTGHDREPVDTSRYPTEAELRRELALRPIFEADDGAILTPCRSCPANDGGSPPPRR